MNKEDNKHNDIEEIGLENYLKQNSSSCDLGFGGGPTEKLLSICRGIDDTKPIRVISNWYWLDVRCTESERQFYDDHGLQLAYLMAFKIMHDTTQPKSVGKWVRTSPLYKFVEPGLFVTKNRIYIMTGIGRRMTVDDDFIDLIG